MSNAIKEALSFDPLAEAERVTGHSYKDDNHTPMLGLLLHVEHAHRKRKLLEDHGDTHYGMKIQAFLDFLRCLGFAELLCDDIPPLGHCSGDKFRIWWRDGVLVTFDSYFGDESINGGAAHFCFRGPRDAMFHCSNGLVNGTEPPVWRGSFDIREGFRFRLEKMEAAGKLLTKWPETGSLCLLHYMDWKQKDRDYVAITAARLARLPAHVREAIIASAGRKA